MNSLRRWMMAVGFCSVLVLGCQGQSVKQAAPGADPNGAWQSSPFLVHSASVKTRGGLIGKLINEALGTTRGEVVWGHHQFGSGSNSGTPQEHKTEYDYGGTFIFRRDGTEQVVTAKDVDEILTALKSALERELT